jgi:DNA-binding NtrC family response regulator
VATNQGLRGLSEDGRFRTDLFYRLSGVEIQVPPLRARRVDISILVAHFLERHQALRSISVSTSALDALKTYDWPGNVRELERVVERAVTLTTSNRIELADLPPRVTGAFVHVLEPSLHDDHTMRAWGSRYARLMLERCDNNKRRTCQALGISYHTLQAYLNYGQLAEVCEPSEDQAVPDSAPREQPEYHTDRSSGLVGEQGRRFLP